MLKFQRSVHTRVKKISVQLLKDFPHIGVRGEVVQVTEGLMRNKLHPHNGAAYMVDGPVISIVKQEPVIKAPKATPQPKAPVAEQKKTTIFDQLVFDEAEAAAPTSKPSQAAPAPSAPPSTPSSTPNDFDWQNEFVKRK